MSEKLTKLALPLDDGTMVNLTIVRATAKIGIERYQLLSKRRDELKDETNDALRVLGLIIYPDLISATIEADGFSQWPIPFLDFVELPEDFVNLWADAVYALNPSWRPIPPETEGEAKNPKSSPKRKRH